jgi:hypothetical protein
MVMTSRSKAMEILEYLRSQLEIPMHLKELHLHICMGESVEIDCTYYPEQKEPDK